MSVSSFHFKSVLTSFYPHFYLIGHVLSKAMLQNKKHMTNTPTLVVYLRMEEAGSQWEQLYVNQTKAKGSVSPEPQQQKTVKPIKSKNAQSPID